MTLADTLLQLAEKAEAATGPDGTLNDAIYAALNPNRRPNIGDAPRFTASLDAAMMLVPEGWGWRVDGGTYHLDGTSSADLAQPVETEFGKGIGIRAQAHAVTPALALTAAALRAQATNGDGR